MCVRRITLDDILARRVKRTPGVELLEGAVAYALLSERGRVSGVKWKASGEEQQARAKVVVGADGVRSFVAKEVGAEIEKEEPVRRAMYYAYFRGIEANEGPSAEFHYRENNLAYCMPVDDGLTVRGSGSIPCYLRIPYGEVWALVGDASMALDPRSGQGIDQGSTHAVFLAKRIGEFLNGESDWDAAMKEYHQERNEYSKKAYRNTSNFSADLRPMTRAALAKRGLI